MERMGPSWSRCWSVRGKEGDRAGRTCVGRDEWEGRKRGWGIPGTTSDSDSIWTILEEAERRKDGIRGKVGMRYDSLEVKSDLGELEGSLLGLVALQVERRD